MKRVESHIFQGMQRDVSISKQQPQFLWDAENIRLTAREGDTLMSVTNEKGSVESGIGTLTGSYMGHCVLGNYLTVFTTTGTYDYIYLITKGPDGEFSMIKLYGGSDSQPRLGFDLRHPLQTLGIYENEFIQKVYWTDGINQPRVINICKDKLSPGASQNYDKNSFDFVPEMTLNDSIKIQKLSDNSGSFPAGVIQYAVTYYNKYGQQSNISCVSPLIATSFANRGGSPEEKISNSFRIKISNPDRSFEYLRLYSIFRSSLNGTPICRRVEDVRLGDGGLSGSGYKVTTSGNISNWFVYKIEGTGINQYSYSNESVPSSGGSYSPEYVPSANLPYVNPDYRYYRFTKSSHPYLVIKVYDEVNKISRWITWGDATRIYISYESVVGGYGEGYYIVGTGNDNKAANLITSNTEIVYQKAAYTSADVVITDNGIIGENVDPQELLYIGGEDITAETIESKDGTLFFGNIELKQIQIEDLKDSFQTTYNASTGKNTGPYINIEPSVRSVLREFAINGTNYIWGNSLNSTQNGYATNPAGFKYGEHYRLGVQFQYKNGKWSEPVYISNKRNGVDLGSFTIGGVTSGGTYYTQFPNLTDNGNTETYHTPNFVGTLNSNICTTLYNRGYRRVRGVVVFPTGQDRLILAQGVLNPTVANIANHVLHTPDYQSSWFFRPSIVGTFDNDSNILQGASVEWRHSYKLFGYTDRGSEVQGLPKEYPGWTVSWGSISDAPKSVDLGDVDIQKQHTVSVTDDVAGNMFYVDRRHVTMHSPEFEFDDTLKNLDFIGTELKVRGYVTFESNVGDIFIETSTPPIGKESQGFVHKTLLWGGSGPCKRLCAGMFYNDWLVDENVEEKNNYAEFPYQNYEFGFMVYPWHKSGSLNNDCNRPANAGVRSAVLKKKIISNILYSRQSFFRSGGTTLNFGTVTRSGVTTTIYPQLVDDDQIGLAKLGDVNYYGDIDTLLSPMVPYSSIISTGENISSLRKEDTDSDGHSRKLFTSSSTKFWKGTWDEWEYVGRHAGDSDGYENNTVGLENRSLLISKESIRMKYKSTPHLVIKLNGTLGDAADGSTPVPNSLQFVELCRDADSSTDFGGISEDAIQGNTWVPAGEAVPLRTIINGTVSYGATIHYDWGDTWYQRYDCLKTYPYTPEDENQIVEIGSFMVESHVNLDGRYDRNRGQDSNLYMSPENFNVINHVYSQLDNFFSYKIMDSDFYKLDRFPSTVSWTLQKNNASEVDTWTNVTMGSTLDMDGNSGKVTSINTSMDTLYCFQERGVSQIMFNSRVQISPSDGVPIEISNNYKVDGSHYISNSIGCPNKFAIAKSPMGLYFVDGVGSTLYLLQGNQMQNISDTHGMGYWFSQQDTQNPWIPGHQNNSAQGMRLCYDNVNGDLYILPHEGQALCYSDQLQQFVSFYDYYAHSIFNIGNSVHALNEMWDSTNQVNKVYMHNLFEGNYNQLLGTYYPSSITFVSNADMQMDKIFTNLETRADFYKNGELQHMHFFDTIRAWNEYQDTDWNDGTAHTTILQHKYFPYSSTSIASNTKKKFRIWRVDIPRAKKWIAYTAEEKQAMINSGSYTSETVPNGHFINVNDRIRNTWCKIKLSMNVPPSDLTGFETSKMEMHDMSVIYYI